MSTARHHAEWLSLVEVSGPFLSLPVLLRVFPQGLDAHDPDSFGRLRQAFEEWQEDQESHRRSGAIHRAWVSFVLSDLLELPEEVIRDGQAVPPGLDVHIPEHHETLRPDFAIVNPTGRPDAGKARMLCQVLPADQELDRPLPGKEWKASAATRMMELLHGTEV
ncbi:MAG TPA: restriction endonuclease, partial [Anaerolineae bacterium]|nr:restriction endonuclease [Anaerolineae bacterium]